MAASPTDHGQIRGMFEDMARASFTTLINHKHLPNLVMTNIAMEAMAHRNRWFTHYKLTGDFPWLCDK